MKYTDYQRLQKIYDNISKLQEYISQQNVTKEDLLNDYALQWLVTTPLYNIGEHVYNISDAYKNSHPEIQWSMIAGLRHRLVHDYEGTNWNIIALVVFDELPVLENQIKKLL
ncbi:MAG: DUF86 domain-containing protein [Thermoguttaceae bacterium]|nr:DUF86 domain-containing protein [Thermoguttaceae bacterium]